MGPSQLAPGAGGADSAPDMCGIMRFGPFGHHVEQFEQEDEGRAEIGLSLSLYLTQVGSLIDLNTCPLLA